MSRINRTNIGEEQAALRRSVRQRERQGEVPESVFGYSSDSELLRDQREKLLTETVIGQEDRVELQFRSKRTMSRRDEKGDGRDSAKGGSEQPSMTELFQLMLSENRRRDEEARRRDDQERLRREEEQRRRDEEYVRREQRWAEQLQAQTAASARPEPRYPPHFDESR